MWDVPPNSSKGKKAAPRFDFSWVGGIASRIRNALGQRTAEETQAIERQSEAAWRESVRRLSQPNTSFIDENESDRVSDNASDYTESEAENEHEHENNGIKIDLNEHEEDESELNALFEAEIDADDVDGDDFDADVLDEFDNNKESEYKDEDEFISENRSHIHQQQVHSDEKHVIEEVENEDVCEVDGEFDNKINEIDEIDEVDEVYAVYEVDEIEEVDDVDEVDDEDVDMEDEIIEIDSFTPTMDNAESTEEPLVYSEYTSEHCTEDPSQGEAMVQDEGESDTSLPPVELSDHPFEEFSSDGMEDLDAAPREDTPRATSEQEPFEQKEKPEGTPVESENCSESKNDPNGETGAVEKPHLTSGVPNFSTFFSETIGSHTVQSFDRPRQSFKPLPSKYVGFLFGPDKDSQTNAQNQINTENTTADLATELDETEKELPTSKNDESVDDKLYSDREKHAEVRPSSENYPQDTQETNTSFSATRPSAISRWNSFNVGFAVAPSDQSPSRPRHIEPCYTSPAVITSKDVLHYPYQPTFGPPSPEFESAADEEFSILSQTAHRSLSGSSLFGGVTVPTRPAFEDMPPPPLKEDPEESLRKAAGAAQTLFAGSASFGGKRKRQDDEDNSASGKKIQKNENPFTGARSATIIPQKNELVEKQPAEEQQDEEQPAEEELSREESTRSHEENLDSSDESVSARRTSRPKPARSIPARKRPMTRSASRALEAEKKASAKHTKKDNASKNIEIDDEKEMEKPARRRISRRRK